MLSCFKSVSMVDRGLCGWDVQAGHQVMRQLLALPRAASGSPPMPAEACTAPPAYTLPDAGALSSTLAQPAPRVGSGPHPAPHAAMGGWRPQAGTGLGPGHNPSSHAPMGSWQPRQAPQQPQAIAGAGSGSIFKPNAALDGWQPRQAAQYAQQPQAALAQPVGVRAGHPGGVGAGVWPQLQQQYRGASAQSVPALQAIAQNPMLAMPVRLVTP